MGESEHLLLGRRERCWAWLGRWGQVARAGLKPWPPLLCLLRLLCIVRALQPKSHSKTAVFSKFVHLP